MIRNFWVFLLAGLVLSPPLAACSGGNGEGADGCEVPRGGGRVVTADWLARSLTVLDHDRAVSGQCSVEATIVRTIDLSAHAPGPLQVEVAPDGRTAVVAVGPGFFAGGGSIFVGLTTPPPPGGTLLVVDLETGEVLGEVATAHIPMGIAIHPDGTRAYTANYGDADQPGTTLSIVDLTGPSLVADVEVGARPEQVSLSADGSLGMVNVTSGSVRVFQTGNVAGTLTDPIPVGTDPSDVAFVDGTDLAVVTNSMSFDLSLLDVSDPSAPTVVDTVPIDGQIPYGATLRPGTSTVLVTTFPGDLYPLEVGTPTSLGPRIDLPSGMLPLTVAVDADGTHGFTPHPVDRSLSVVDLDTGQAHTLTWLEDTGPTYVAVTE